MKPEPPVTSTTDRMRRTLDDDASRAADRCPYACAVRVLIFSADIGEGHDLPARAVRDGVLARCPGADVRILDTLAVAGPVVRTAVRTGAETILGVLAPLFDLQYLLIGRFGPTRRLTSRLVTALAGRRLLRAVAASRPDVIVCTYPLANEVLCASRLRGRLDTPVVSAITDLAALRYWAHPGCDLHLTIHPESDAEIGEIAGPGCRIVAVRGLTSAEFDAPVAPRDARRALDLDASAPIVVVSGGGWGIGDLRGATRAGLSAAPGVHVLVLCGHSRRAASELRAEFGAEPRVRVLGFTDRMSDVLAAGDVLVHSTAGLTVLEALVRGMRVISYGWGVGHVRVNNRAYRRFGLAEVVGRRSGLRPAIRRALDAPRIADGAYGLRPAAAELILQIAATGVDGGDRARRAEHAAPS
jgi:UDP-N-acetylglucosamine:LPS N-acetylglucosamine transferase